jgi:hexosaminidase
MRKTAYISALTLMIALTGQSPTQAGPPAPGLAAVAAAPAEVASVRPKTVPALQRWRSWSGSFRLGTRPRIVVPPAHARQVARTARVFAADLRAVTKRPVRVYVGRTVRPGDIRLAIDPAQRLGREGYQMRVAGAIRIIGRTDAGVFYGTRTVLQLMRQSRTVARGVARDWPRYPERGLFVDLGHQYLSAGFLRQQVRQLAYLKMNTLHLHLSDNGGFRMESTRHPEIVADQHLTKRQLHSLILLARKHHITVIPEVDLPGHAAGILRAHPEFQLKNVLGIPDETRLDITNPKATAFVRDLIAELIPLFPGTTWHLGGDEFIKSAEYPLYPALADYAKKRYGADATGKDAVLGFLNDLNRFVRAKGKHARTWNDGSGGGTAVKLDKNVSIAWWTNFNPLGDPPLPAKPAELITAGHRILNMGWWPTYYTGGPPRPVMSEAYVKWKVHDFYGPLYANSTVQAPPDSVPPASRQNLGSLVALFTDLTQETEAEYAVGLWPVLNVVAQKTWESRQPATYAAFTRITAAIGHAPRSAR